MDKKERLFNQATIELKLAKPNTDKALKMMRLSMDLGYSKAYYAVATWYLHGSLGIKKNLKMGVKLLKIAATLQVPEAIFDLAVCYESGKGVNKSPKKAFELYLIAALNGDLDSMVSVGRCYYYGIGIEKNIRISKIWLDKAQGLGAKW